MPFEVIFIKHKQEAQLIHRDLCLRIIENEEERTRVCLDGKVRLILILGIGHVCRCVSRCFPERSKRERRCETDYISTHYVSDTSNTMESLFFNAYIFDQNYPYHSLSDTFVYAYDCQTSSSGQLNLDSLYKILPFCIVMNYPVIKSINLAKL